jgi:hypothetical protein
MMGLQDTADESLMTLERPPRQRVGECILRPVLDRPATARLLANEYQ